MKRLLSTLLVAAGISGLAVVAAPPDQPVKLLIITGDHGHDWKATTRALEEILSAQGFVAPHVTVHPKKDLTPEHLAKYDVLLLNYRDTPKGGPETKWTEENKKAFLEAVRGGKGLVVLHHASSAFVEPNWDEFEKATAGGWRKRGFHGPRHEFDVKTTDAEHPISKDMPRVFHHASDELYQNSLVPEGAVVLATAYSDPAKPKGTGKDEPVIWVGKYGEGRVFHDALGHDAQAMADPNFGVWLRRGVEWAATGKVFTPAPAK